MLVVKTSRDAAVDTLIRIQIPKQMRHFWWLSEKIAVAYCMVATASGSTVLALGMWLNVVINMHEKCHTSIAAS